MRGTKKRRIQRILVLLDIVAMSAAFVLGLSLRYDWAIAAWQIQLYMTVYILTLLIYLFLFLWRGQHEGERLASYDVFELILNMIKNRGLQYALLVLLLALSHNFQRVSRLVLLYMVIIDVILAGAVRICLRQVELRRERSARSREHYVIVTTSVELAVARIRLQEILPEDADIAGEILIDTISERDETEQLLNCIPDAAHIFVYLCRNADIESENRAGRIIRLYQRLGFPVSVRMFMQGQELPSSMAVCDGEYMTAELAPWNRTVTVLGVEFTVSDVGMALFKVMDALSGGLISGQYICFSNVHATVMAYEDVVYRKVLNESAFTFADGEPIARKLRSMGYEGSRRVAGPDFMDAVFRATMDGKLSHYFYGSTQETIDKLCEELPKRYPGIRIAGAVSPPFRPETPEEDAASVAAMNDSGAAFIWIGLGAPKQEKWMAAHRGRVNGLMLGVGAGFNFYAGTVKRAPKWMQRVGLEWLYRLFQDPKRLANRYIVTNVKFLWYMMTGAGRQGEN